MLDRASADTTDPPGASVRSTLLVPVLRDKEIRSWPKYPQGGRATYVSLPTALVREYPTDAHFAAYSVPSIARRLAKDAVLDSAARASLQGGVSMVAVVFDVDCPEAHKGNPGATDAWWLDETEKVAALLRAHPGGFVYRTRGGYRIVCVLAAPIVFRDGTDAEAWSIRYCAWIAYLRREFEIAADPSCKDWTRLYRLPHATRDEGGRPERRETIGDPESIGAWACEPTKEDLAVAKALCRKRAKKQEAKDELARGPTVPPADGVLVKLFASRGWLGDEIEPGKWKAVCPNEAAHTKGEAFDSSTVLYAPSPGEAFGWLHCSHSHCAGRGPHDVLATFTEAEIAAGRGRTVPAAAGAAEPGAAPSDASDGGECQPWAAEDRDALDAAPPVYRGDHAELADMLLDRLAQDRSQLAHDEGALYRYEPAKGLWAPVEKADLRRVVKGFAGAKTVSGSLKIQVSDADGAITFAGAVVRRPAFFAGAPRGVHFRDAFVEVSAAGVIELRPHSREHRSRAAFDFDHAGDADCPRWKEFLAVTFRGDADAAQKIAWIQEFGGAALLAIAPRYQKYGILLGDGANGKNVVIDVLVGCMPAGTDCAIPPHDWGQEYRLAMLAGKHLNVVSELPEGEILASGAFKSVITGDPITGRPIREPPFPFRPQAAHLFAANLLPPVSDHSHGFWRRPVLVAFNNVVPADEQIESLAEDILAAERPAILCWLLEGAARLRRSGRYTIPPSSVAEVAKWRGRTDLVRAFVAERTAPVEDVAEGAPAKILYAAYREWASENGHRYVVASNTFGERMRILGRRPRHGRRGNVYPVRLLGPNEEVPDDGGDPPSQDPVGGSPGGEGPVKDSASGSSRATPPPTTTSGGREGGEGLRAGKSPHAGACARAREDQPESPSRPSQTTQSQAPQGIECEGLSFTVLHGPSPIAPSAESDSSIVLTTASGTTPDGLATAARSSRAACHACGGADFWISTIAGDAKCRRCARPVPGAERAP